jgi:diguanylate cyclase (GGDEF)-like protein
MKNEIVPLAERLRYMQVFRFVTALLVLAVAALVPDVAISLSDAALVTGVYLASSVVSELFWRKARGRGLLLFGAMILVDGVYLGWMSYETGGTLSPLRFVVLVHLIVVTLLASYRTGIKLAFWHSLLLFIVFHAEEAGMLASVEEAYGSLPGTGYSRIAGFILALWIVALTTATFSAVNERELRRRRLDVESLAGLAEKLAGSNEPRLIAKLLVEELADAFGFTRVVAFAAPSGDPALVAVAGIDEHDEIAAGTDDLVARTMRDDEIDLLTEVSEESDPRISALMPDAKNLVVVPLKAEGHALGAVVAEHSFRRGSRIEERVVAMAQQFASHAALALSNAWLLERMESMAVTDALTGVHNRGHFQKDLEMQLNRAGRAREEVSLVMLDIDHFKKINDTHGHQVGDEVLRVVAATLAKECRSFDTVARYGGEEFAVILPTTHREVARSVAERLRTAVAQADTPVPVTTSGGVAVFPAHAVTADELVRAADDALYASKAAGRNRISIASTDSDPVAVPTS